jgi:hypothetical protein
MRIRALVGASSHTDFSKDNYVSEGLFGLIVGRLDICLAFFCSSLPPFAPYQGYPMGVPFV